MDQTAEAKQFRASLKTQTLSDFLNDPSGGATLILPEIAFVIPFKTLADTLIAKDPIGFLKQFQTAVAASNTPPMSPQVQALSQAFDSQFGNGIFDPRSKPKELTFSAGAQAAHELILEHYLTHMGPTGWITFTNIGVWGDDVIGRSAITEFIQYGNGRSTAAYYHSFRDGTGAALDGNDPHGYILTFPAGQIPQAKRFWSVTAYTPEAIELVPNLAEKYLVASYTPGPQYNADGSVSIYLATERPRGVPMANWLPIPRRQFNLILRVYSPEGAVADNTYVPPPINRSH